MCHMPYVHIYQLPMTCTEKVPKRNDDLITIFKTTIKCTWYGDERLSRHPRHGPLFDSYEPRRKVSYNVQASSFMNFMNMPLFPSSKSFETWICSRPFILPEKWNCNDIKSFNFRIEIPHTSYNDVPSPCFGTRAWAFKLEKNIIKAHKWKSEWNKIMVKKLSKKNL